MSRVLSLTYDPVETENKNEELLHRGIRSESGRKVEQESMRRKK